MDKSWMLLRHRYWPQYIDGIDEFIEFTRRNGKIDSQSRTRCPCNKCKNSVFKHIDIVKEHLIDNGMEKAYTRWVHHGEDYEVFVDDNDDDGDGDEEGQTYDGLEDLIQDVRGHTTPDHPTLDIHSENGDVDPAILEERELLHSNSPNTGEENMKSFDILLNDARKPLYPGCEKFSKLDFLIKLLHLKTINRWSNKSFDMALKLIKSALPVGETLPKSHYEVKSLMRDLGLGYIPIHACQNDCVLFWKEHENLDICPECGESRYKILEGKGKKIPHKVLRYFPLKPRLQRLFMSRMTTADMVWHKEKRVHEENIFRHPADSRAWEEFDKEYEWFANEPRNVRLGLASDGFNPFGDMSNAYSMWPVMLVPYNLPPWKCMKEPFIFMSLLIPGPRGPGNDIDVFLRPLIDELKELWENGAETYDAKSKQTFKMHAAVLWTINDFPAYANLSGWSTKGKMACPVCNKDTSSMYLKNGHKLCYMNHFRFLPPRHHLRRTAMRLFSGKNDSRTRPKDLSGDDLLLQLEGIEHQKFGKASTNKKRKRVEAQLNWTKKSIFFELPYWRTLKLRHNLDVMHIEKNICENVLGTVLKIDTKTKDTINARLDLEALGIMEDLHLKPNGDNFNIPHACFTFSPEEKKSFCEWVKSVKFPDGYASNISRCVKDKEYKISSMKSHDCHVFLQRLLPVAVRGVLTESVSTALIELGIFFRELCCRTLRLEVLRKMENQIVILLCKLEKIFPPAFFDVMVHLAVHLPHEAILGGPVQYRWMYPIERFLHTLKQYVRNKARPEGSIAEAYIATECLTFCSMYLEGIETRFNRDERNTDRSHENQKDGLQAFSQNVRPIKGAIEVVTLDMEDYAKAQYYVLNNSEEIASYLEEHLTELQRQNPNFVQERHEKHFAAWFRERMRKLRMEKSPEATDDLYSLARGPDLRVTLHSGCIVNGIRFHTKERDSRLRTQNSGVVVKGDHQSKDTDFYGVITHIIELEYLYNNKVFLFKCDWWDVENKKIGIQTDRYFTSVNISRTWYKEDPYVLSTQAEQVFYLSDNKLGGNWQVVQKLKPRNMYDILEKEESDGPDNENEAYQQEEQVREYDMVDHGDASEMQNDTLNEEIAIVSLTRNDIFPEEVEASVVHTKMRTEQIVDDFINNEETDEEDDTLMDYCTEEDVISFSEDDSDLE